MEPRVGSPVTRCASAPGAPDRGGGPPVPALPTRCLGRERPDYTAGLVPAGRRVRSADRGGAARTGDVRHRLPVPFRPAATVTTPRRSILSPRHPCQRDRPSRSSPGCAAPSGSCSHCLPDRRVGAPGRPPGPARARPAADRLAAAHPDRLLPGVAAPRRVVSSPRLTAAGLGFLLVPFRKRPRAAATTSRRHVWCVSLRRAGLQGGLVGPEPRPAGSESRWPAWVRTLHGDSDPHRLEVPRGRSRSAPCLAPASRSRLVDR